MVYHSNKFMPKNVENYLVASLLLVCIAVLLFIVLIPKTSEGFTQVYFENHQNIKKFETLNYPKQVPFSFVIVNSENTDMSYTYQVSLEGSQRAETESVNSVDSRNQPNQVTRFKSFKKNIASEIRLVRQGESVRISLTISPDDLPASLQ